MNGTTTVIPLFRVKSLNDLKDASIKKRADQWYRRREEKRRQLEEKQRQREEQEEADRVRREVKAVVTFFDAASPDFITDAIVEAIAEACRLKRIKQPTYEDRRQTRATLEALFSKTKFLDLGESAVASKRR